MVGVPLAGTLWCGRVPSRGTPTMDDGPSPEKQHGFLLPFVDLRMLLCADCTSVTSCSQYLFLLLLIAIINGMKKQPWSRLFLWSHVVGVIAFYIILWFRTNPNGGKSDQSKVKPTFD